MLANADLCQPYLIAAVQQVVRVLNRNRARQAACLGQLQVFHRSPRGFVGQPCVANPACFHFLVKRVQYFFEGCEVLLSMLVTQLAEKVGVALRPMQLVQVDPVCPKPA